MHTNQDPQRCNECGRMIGDDEVYADYGGGGNEVVLCIDCDAKADRVLADDEEPRP